MKHIGKWHFVVALAALAVVFVLSWLLLHGNNGTQSKDHPTNELLESEVTGEIRDTAAMEGTEDLLVIDPTTRDAEMTSSASDEISKVNSSLAESTASPATLAQREEACYEHWLAAALVTVSSMQWPEFEPGDFYLSGETALADKQNSAGVYFTFTCEGESHCLFARPIAEARTEKGATDIYSPIIGYAAMEEVGISTIQDSFFITQIKDIDILIRQSVQIILYES